MPALDSRQGEIVTPPIFIYEQNDLNIFANLDAAAKYPEPIDIMNNEFIAYDGEGRLLRLSVKSVGRRQIVEIESTETEPTHKEELKRILIDFFGHVGVNKEWLYSVSFEDLIHKTHEYAK